MRTAVQRREVCVEPKKLKRKAKESPKEKLKEEKQEAKETAKDPKEDAMSAKDRIMLETVP